MKAQEIEQKRQKLIEKYGPWNHNILLTDEIYTLDKNSLKDAARLKLMLQLVSDIAKKPIKELRILDLGCANGLYAVEFARLGANVVAIEGREANISKAFFTREVLELDNLELYQADVRTLSKEKFGSFDVVLCIGILYHLDGPSVFEFMEHIAEVCTGLTIIDTHISLNSEVKYSYKGKDYWGKEFFEFAPGTDSSRMLSAAIDNTESFWPSIPSLYNLLAAVGFTSAFECWLPTKPAEVRDRITVLAVKGQPVQVISIPLINSQLPKTYPEQLSTAVFEPQQTVDLKLELEQAHVQINQLNQQVHKLEEEWAIKNSHIAYLENQLVSIKKGRIISLTSFLEQKLRRIVKR